MDVVEAVIEPLEQRQSLRHMDSCGTQPPKLGRPPRGLPRNNGAPVYDIVSVNAG